MIHDALLRSDDFRFDEIEAAEAPSAESFWGGMFLGLALAGLLT